MTTCYTVYLANEIATVAAGERLGKSMMPFSQKGAVVYLEGELGAGKTTFCRGFLGAFGHTGPVKSPTYTLVEPYAFDGVTVYHFDLYRLGNGEELEFMGIRDYFQPGSLCLVEWPERGEGFLPEPDLRITVVPEGAGRRLAVQAATDEGRASLATVSGT